MDEKIFKLLEQMNSRLYNLEMKLQTIEEKIDFNISISRSHLIRVKNQEPIDDQTILYGRPYNDLSPQTAIHILKKSNQDFILLDVSEENYTSSITKDLKNLGCIHIPYHELTQKIGLITSKTIPILVISEDGVKSILACETLVKRGFFNLNNISGGHQFFDHVFKEINPTGIDLADHRSE